MVSKCKDSVPYLDVHVIPMGKEACVPRHDDF